MFIGALFSAQLLRGRIRVRTDHARPNARRHELLARCHDWMGGYPYETATAMSFTRGFARWVLRKTVVPHPPRRGFLGSGCHEFVYVEPDWRIRPAHKNRREAQARPSRVTFASMVSLNFKGYRMA